MRAYLLKKKMAEIYENIRKQYTVDLEQHGGFRGTDTLQSWKSEYNL